MQQDIYKDYLAAAGVPSLEQIIIWADALFPGGFRLLADDLCFPEDQEDWTERERQDAYIAIGEAIEREKRRMLEDREQIKQETARAAVVHFELDPMRAYRPVIQELDLTKSERAQYTHKFAVLVAGQAAIVYRLGEGTYRVIDDEEHEEARDNEAYQVLMAAARYLEIDLRLAREVAAEEEQPGEGEAARWTLTISGQACQVARYDREDGPDYQVIAP